MVAVTSHRPIDQCTPEIAKNQLRAHKSWIQAFERMIYVGRSCDELSSISSEFVPGEDRPSIKSLCAIAMEMGTWACLVNSDIVVSPKLKEVERRMTAQGVKCAISQRYDLDSGFVIDQGLDFFCGIPEVWKRIHGIIPPDFRIGFGAWDLWMLNAFVAEFGRKCADVTRTRCIFHPKHGDRLNPNWESPALQHKYCLVHHWPSTVIYG